jgi:hypothetical protein
VGPHPTKEEADPSRNLNIAFLRARYNQEGARVGLESPQVAKTIGEMAAVFQQRSDLVVQSLNAIDGVRCQNPKGAFYVFPNIAGVCQRLGIMEAFQSLQPDLRKKTSPSTLFQMFLLFEHLVATLDRKSFGRIGTEHLHYLRLSIATDTESLTEGMKRLRLPPGTERVQRFFRKRAPLMPTIRERRRNRRGGVTRASRDGRLGRRAPHSTRGPAEATGGPARRERTSA